MESLYNKFLFLVLILTLFCSCQEEDNTQFIKISGATMGTTYNIIYRDVSNQDYNQEISQLLKDYNQEVSTYIENSQISKFNQSDTGVVLEKEASLHFIRNF